MSKTFKGDPENYTQMSMPFENSEEADNAIKGFFDELSEIRKKYKIRDALCVVYGGMKYEDGKQGEFMTHCIYGSQLNALAMAAFAYGTEKKDHEELIGKLLQGKRK